MYAYLHLLQFWILVAAEGLAIKCKARTLIAKQLNEHKQLKVSASIFNTFIQGF